MFRALRFLISFLISFMILSIPIGKKPLFSHAHKFLAPYTGQLFNQTSSMMDEVLKKGANKTKMFFTNSTPHPSPQKKENIDKVDSSLSATQHRDKQSDVEVILESRTEKITAEEEEMLKKVLKKEL